MEQKLADAIPVGVILNLIDACLGCVDDGLQAIILSYSKIHREIAITSYLLLPNEASFENIQEIVDELDIRLYHAEITVASRVIVGYEGVLNLTEHDQVFFLRKGFEILTARSRPEYTFDLD